MGQGTGVRAGRGSEFTCKLLIFSSRPVRMVLVQSWPGASVVGSWEVSERYVIRDFRAQRVSSPGFVFGCSQIPIFARPWADSATPWSSSSPDGFRYDRTSVRR